MRAGWGEKWEEWEEWEQWERKRGGDGKLSGYAADSRQQTADSRQQTADSRQQTANSKELTHLWGSLG